MLTPLNTLKILLCGLTALLVVGCQTTATTHVGSPQWQEWVESVVQSSDAKGHGPDVGSAEWCSVIDKTLFAGQSNLIPCSNEWNTKVDNEISH